MDLGRFLQVAWRFRVLLAAGFLLAGLVAVLSFVRVGLDDGKPSVSYRDDETWVAASTLLVTQKGFPWGRAILDDMVEVEPGRGDADPVIVPRFGDESRYSGLAALYAELIKGDAVHRRATAGALSGQRYDAEVVVLAGQGTPLPLIRVTGYGPSPSSATSIAERASRAFIEYLNQQQVESGIPRDKRVDVVITQRDSGPEIFQGRPIVRPAMIFLLISMAFVAIPFGLENLRPAGPRGQGDEPGAEVDELWPTEREPLHARESA